MVKLLHTWSEVAGSIPATLAESGARFGDAPSLLTSWAEYPAGPLLEVTPIGHLYKKSPS